MKHVNVKLMKIDLHLKHCMQTSVSLACLMTARNILFVTHIENNTCMVSVIHTEVKNQISRLLKTAIKNFNGFNGKIHWGILKVEKLLGKL